MLPLPCGRNIAAFAIRRRAHALWGTGLEAVGRAASASDGVCRAAFYPLILLPLLRSDVDCVIGTNQSYSDGLSALVETGSGMHGDEHWINAGDARFTKRKLLTADVSPPPCANSILTLRTPGYMITFVDTAGSCENDLIKAVNLTRPGTDFPAEAMAAAQRVIDGVENGDRVEVSHLLGGPCQDDKVCCCVVPGATGWTVVQDLADAVELASQQARMHSEECGPIHEGQTVTIHSLKSAAVCCAAGAASFGSAARQGGGGRIPATAEPGK